MKKKSGYFTRAEVVESLRLMIGETPQVEFAKRLGISPQLMTDVLKKRRPVPESALVVLGLEEVEQLYRQREVKR